MLSYLAAVALRVIAVVLLVLPTAWALNQIYVSGDFMRLALLPLGPLLALPFWAWAMRIYRRGSAWDVPF